MNKVQIKNKLIYRGYSLPGAETASSDLISINDKLKSCLDEWGSQVVTNRTML